MILSVFLAVMPILAINKIFSKDPSYLSRRDNEMNLPVIKYRTKCYMS